MNVIITCKYEKDRTEKKQPRKIGDTGFFFSITLSFVMETSSLIWPNFKLIRAFMYVIVTCKYEMDPMNKAEKSGNTVFPIISLWGIFSNAQGQLTPQSVVRYG